jgi:hypothetical protein
MKIKLVSCYHNCRCQIHQFFEQLLFYEFASATDRDIFKRGDISTEPVHNICFCQLRASALYVDTFPSPNNDVINIFFK